MRQERTGKQHGAEFPTSFLLSHQAEGGAVWRICGHPKTPENTRHFKSQGWKKCRICNRARMLKAIHNVRARQRAQAASG
jgi:hypothetical protein